MKSFVRKTLRNFQFILAVIVASLGTYFDFNTYILEYLYGDAPLPYMAGLFAIEVLGFLGLTWIAKFLFRKLRDPQSDGGYFGTKLSRDETKAVDKHWRRKFHYLRSRSAYVRHLIERDAKI